MAKICEYSRGRKLIHQLSGNVGVEGTDYPHTVVTSLHIPLCIPSWSLLQGLSSNTVYISSSVAVIDAVQSLVLKHSGREAADDLVLQLYKGRYVLN